MANDPVCGMKLDEKKAATRVDYRDKTYYFCSTQCRQAFTAAPEKYVNAGASGPARGGDGTRQHSQRDRAPAQARSRGVKYRPVDNLLIPLACFGSIPGPLTLP